MQRNHGLNRCDEQPGGRHPAVAATAIAQPGVADSFAGAWLADLHVHSRHAYATSPDGDLPHMAAAAAAKGLTLLGTGDCVHPGWAAELREGLVPAGDGVFRLRPPIERAALAGLPLARRRPVLFTLTVEISTVYQAGGRTRRVHHVVHLPDMDARDRLAARLGAIGNIASDGRPILRLDSRDLLEIVLEGGGFLVPAHLWTPWYSALGAQSGFDGIDECYRDLAGEIFAVETGLSSDPPMNWRVSALDRFRLVSSSDAHSPGRLGREATLFTGVPGFAAIRRALATGDGYAGTVEFFPEEGKYHADGHRACGLRLTPAETRAAGGRCPRCGRKIAIGVAHRVEQLADRAGPVPPPTAGAFTALMELASVLAAVVGRGEASAAVASARARALAALGTEWEILATLPLDHVARHDAVLAEAVRRLRAGEVVREAGYDGVPGTIRLFAPGELSRASGADPRAARAAAPRAAPPRRPPASRRAASVP